MKRASLFTVTSPLVGHRLAPLQAIGRVATARSALRIRPGLAQGGRDGAGQRVYGEAFVRCVAVGLAIEPLHAGAASMVQRDDFPGFFPEDRVPELPGSVGAWSCRRHTALFGACRPSGPRGR